jgi:adenylylsulfate kinase-like enzyme
MDSLPGVFWLGGGSGAGKSTVALAAARRLDLRLYAIDGHTYEHAGGTRAAVRSDLT